MRVVALKPDEWVMVDKGFKLYLFRDWGLDFLWTPRHYDLLPSLVINLEGDHVFIRIAWLCGAIALDGESL